MEFITSSLYSGIECKASSPPFYMIKIITKQGTDSEWFKDYIWSTTGFVPTVYDKGTHYVTNMRLTLEILKTLQDLDFVLGVTGDYTWYSNR
jgi:hypothetical protein